MKLSTFLGCSDHFESFLHKHTPKGQQESALPLLSTSFKPGLCYTCSRIRQLLLLELKNHSQQTMHIERMALIHLKVLYPLHKLTY